MRFDNSLTDGGDDRGFGLVEADRGGDAAVVHAQGIALGVRTRG